MQLTGLWDWRGYEWGAVSFSVLTSEMRRQKDKLSTPCVCVCFQCPHHRELSGPWGQETPRSPQAEAGGPQGTILMSSHQGPAVAQGNGAPASNRVADTVELAELGPLLEEKGKRAVTSPTKVSHLPGQPLLRPVGLPRATVPWTVCPDEGRKQSGQAPYTMENPCRSGQLEGSWEEQVLPQAAVEAAPGRFISFFRVPEGQSGEIRPCPWRGLAGPLVQPKWAFRCA